MNASTMRRSRAAARRAEWADQSGSCRCRIPEQVPGHHLRIGVGPGQAALDHPAEEVRRGVREGPVGGAHRAVQVRVLERAVHPGEEDPGMAFSGLARRRRQPGDIAATRSGRPGPATAAPTSGGRRPPRR